MILHMIKNAHTSDGCPCNHLKASAQVAFTHLSIVMSVSSALFNAITTICPETISFYHARAERCHRRCWESERHTPAQTLGELKMHISRQNTDAIKQPYPTNIRPAVVAVVLPRRARAQALDLDVRRPLRLAERRQLKEDEISNCMSWT